MNSGYVLVIMPEASQRRRVCALLAATGQVVKEFGIRPEALAAVRLHAPDIVVLDLVLTDADAFALAAELREAAGDAELPILAVCGAFGRPTAARMQEARLLGPILKPVSANMLLRTFLDARDSGSVSPTWISRTARETGPAARDRVSQALLGVSDLAARAHQGPDGLAASIRPCLDLCGCAGASVFTCQPGARLELVTRCGAPELADAVVVASYDSPGFFDRVTRATEPVRIDHDAPGDPLAQAFSTAGRGQVTVLMPIGEPGAGRGLLALTANLDPGERGDLVDLARGLGPVLGLMLELDRQRVGAAVLAAGLAQQQTSALLEAGIAHDLRNVLTVIVGNTGLLLDESKPGTPGHEDLIAIREAASHASLLARRLTSPGGSAGQPGIVPVAGVLADSERLLQRVLGSDIALTLGGLTSRAWIRVDPTELQRVLINLASNAREAMPAGGRFVLDVADVVLDSAGAAALPGLLPGTHALITVTDSGRGMDEATRSRLFEPYFTTRQGIGTGLGLFNCLDIVRRHGGTIDVLSEPGKGTTFRIFLPEAEPAPRSSTAAHAEPGAAPADSAGDARARRSPAADATLTVLVIEDDSQVRRVVAQVLREAQYKVLTAGDGADALAVSRRHGGTIDLLLSDLGLPGMDASSAADRLRKERPGMRSMFMSGTPESMVSRAGSTAWTGRLLLKPFTPSGLLGAVRAALESSAIERHA